MKALLKTALLGLALASTASMASNFTGPEAGVSVTMNGASFLADNKSSNNYDGNYGQQSIGIKLHGGYGLDLGNDTVLVLGMDYNPTEIKSGSIDSVTGKIGRAWTLSLAPGMKLNDSSLAYAKLSYEAGKFSVKSPIYSEEESISGFGYGVGLRTEINKNTFLETEIKQVNYKKFTKNNSDITNSSTVGSVGVVFKF
jgi:opacity protein-like surface antigen